MSLPAFQTTVVNGTGDILTAATVTVTVESTGAAAVLFSDRNGTIGLGSGGVFSVNGTTAFAQFFASPGEYRIEANDAVSGFSETWRYQVLSGTASLVDTGLLTGNVPTANQLSMVGQTVNYTGANLNPNVFEGNAANDYIAAGFAESATVAVFTLPLLNLVAPASITTVGTFNVADTSGANAATSVTPVLSSASSFTLGRLIVSGLTGLVAGDKLILKSSSASSKITVNI